MTCPECGEPGTLVRVVNKRRVYDCEACGLRWMGPPPKTPPKDVA